MCGEDKFGSQLDKQHKDDRRNEHLKWLSVCVCVYLLGKRVQQKGAGVWFLEHIVTLEVSVFRYPRRMTTK